MEAKDKTPFDYLTTTVNGHTLADAFRLGKKAGRREGYSAGLIDGQYTNHKRHGKKMTQARQEGRMEVVEWVSQHIELVVFPDNKFYDAWQPQLKEWGIR